MRTTSKGKVTMPAGLRQRLGLLASTAAVTSWA